MHPCICTYITSYLLPHLICTSVVIAHQCMCTVRLSVLTIFGDFVIIDLWNIIFFTFATAGLPFATIWMYWFQIGIWGPSLTSVNTHKPPSYVQRCTAMINSTCMYIHTSTNVLCTHTILRMDGLLVHIP